MNNIQKLKFLHLLRDLYVSTIKLDTKQRNKFNISVNPSSESIPPEYIDDVHKSINEFRKMPLPFQRLLTKSIATGTHNNSIMVHGENIPRPMFRYTNVMHDPERKQIHMWATTPHDPKVVHQDTQAALLRSAAHNLIHDVTRGPTLLQQKIPEISADQPLLADNNRRMIAEDTSKRLRRLQLLKTALMEFQGTLMTQAADPAAKMHGRQRKQVNMHKSKHAAGQFIPSLASELTRRFKTMVQSPTKVGGTPADQSFKKLMRVISQNY